MRQMRQSDVSYKRRSRQRYDRTSRQGLSDRTSRTDLSVGRIGHDKTRLAVLELAILDRHRPRIGRPVTLSPPRMRTGEDRVTT
jgi:hypothetical protein